MKSEEVFVSFEVDSDLLAQFSEFVKPYGITPEEMAKRFLLYMVDPNTKDHALHLIRQWQAEEEQGRGSPH